jgi:hypothetical protein
MGYQKIWLFVLISKNVHVTLLKSVPKKVLAKKLFYQLKDFKKSVFWAKLFFTALFTKVICTF